MIAMITTSGESAICIIDLVTNDAHRLDLPINSISSNGVIRLSNEACLIIGASHTHPTALYRLEVRSGRKFNLIKLYEPKILSLIPEAFISIPHGLHDIKALHRRSERRDSLKGFFYLPRNPNHESPKQQKPPLIIMLSGPGTHFGPGFSLETQFWTSKGYAVLLLNHTGSSGYGKEHRDAIMGVWGISDAYDAKFAIEKLTEARLIDVTRVGIQGKGKLAAYSALCASVLDETGRGTGFRDYSGVVFEGIGNGDMKDLLEHPSFGEYYKGLLRLRGVIDQSREHTLKLKLPTTLAAKLLTRALFISHKGGDDDPSSQEISTRAIVDIVNEQTAQYHGEATLATFSDLSESSRVSVIEAEISFWRRTLVDEARGGMATLMVNHMPEYKDQEILDRDGRVYLLKIESGRENVPHEISRKGHEAAKSKTKYEDLDDDLKKYAEKQNKYVFHHHVGNTDIERYGFWS
jgi:hypothetical protein